MKKLVCALAGLMFLGWTNLSMAQSAAEQNVGGVKSLEERIEQLEEVIGRTPASGKWYDRIQISGLIEVEAGYANIDYAEGEDEETGDVDLATVELVVDAAIAEHVDGHVMLKYEEDEVFVDEGFITLSGTDNFPGYLIAGRQYIPFGWFDSHFVTDPTTLSLGETNEGAVVAGYRIGGELVDISVGAFNGKIDESGEDDVVDSFVARVVVLPVEGLTAGVSYTSNLASADAFADVLDALGVVELDDLVGGWSAFVTYEFLERFKLIGEYVSALDEFEDDAYERTPAAWNLELGASLNDAIELAVRYGGSDEGEDFLPESQYGAVLNWGFFDNANLAVEYLHSEFEDDAQDVDTFIAQLAVEF